MDVPGGGFFYSVRKFYEEALRWVTLSTGPIPRAPVTFFIIILYFESPATTSPAAQQTSVSVKHIRLGVPLRYDGKPRVLLHNIVKWSVSDWQVWTIFKKGKIMKYHKPSFFDQFKCIGSACTDTCCAGWEIEVDETTAEGYLTEKGAFGDRLRREIGSEPGEYFFKLQNNRCPFLNKENLCDIFINLGEDRLCLLYTSPSPRDTR